VVLVSVGKAVVTLTEPLAVGGGGGGLVEGEVAVGGVEVELVVPTVVGDEVVVAVDDPTVPASSLSTPMSVSS
jgi:hypothetical protein